MIIDSSTMWKNRLAYERMQEVYDDFLSRITVPYKTRYVDTRHGKTYVITAGNPENPPLILWHGMSASSTMWINEMNHFADDYYVITADVPGNSGRSEAVKLNRKSAQHSEWAVDVMNALDIERAFHAGLSGGGWMILKLATMDSEKIVAAVLMSSGGFTPVNPMMIVKLLPHFLIAPFISTRKFAIRFLKMMAPPDYELTEDDITMFELIGNFKAENGVPAFSDAELAKMTAPTLLLMGEYEVPFNPIDKLIKRARNKLPGLVSAEVLPGLGHAMNGENPEMIHDKIRTFLEKYKGQLRE